MDRWIGCVIRYWKVDGAKRKVREKKKIEKQKSWDVENEIWLGFKSSIFFGKNLQLVISTFVRNEISSWEIFNFSSRKSFWMDPTGCHKFHEKWEKIEQKLQRQQIFENFLCRNRPLRSICLIKKKLFQILKSQFMLFSLFLAFLCSDEIWAKRRIHIPFGPTEWVQATYLNKKGFRFGPTIDPYQPLQVSIPNYSHYRMDSCPLLYLLFSLSFYVAQDVLSAGGQGKSKWKRVNSKRSKRKQKRKKRFISLFGFRGNFIGKIISCWREMWQNGSISPTKLIKRSCGLGVYRQNYCHLWFFFLKLWRHLP